MIQVNQPHLKNKFILTSQFIEQQYKLHHRHWATGSSCFGFWLKRCLFLFFFPLRFWVFRGFRIPQVFRVLGVLWTDNERKFLSWRTLAEIVPQSSVLFKYVSRNEIRSQIFGVFLHFLHSNTSGIVKAKLTFEFRFSSLATFCCQGRQLRLKPRILPLQPVRWRLWLCNSVCCCLHWLLFLPLQLHVPLLVQTERENTNYRCVRFKGWWWSEWAQLQFLW